MSTNAVTNGNRRTKPKSVVGNNSKQPKFSDIRTRLFEPKRIEKSFKLDEIVLGMLDNCKEFLTEEYGQTPQDNKLIELFIEEGINNMSGFQAWLKRKGSQPDTEAAAVANTGNHLL